VVAERLLNGELARRLDREVTRELTGRFYRSLIARNAITCPAQTLIPREAAERIGFVMEHRRASIDWEYHLRIARSNPVTLHRHSLVRYRFLPTSISGPLQQRGFINTFKDIPILRQRRNAVRRQIVHGYGGTCAGEYGSRPATPTTTPGRRTRRTLELRCANFSGPFPRR
jgi:hypothetical protein